MMNVTMTAQRDNPAWYRQRWPWILISGPAAVVVAGVITVWLAVVSNDGLVTDDYYKQGLAVNQRLQRDHQADSLGLGAHIMRSGQNIRLMLASTGETPLPASLTVRLSHPTRAGQDQSVAVVQEGPGMYSGKLQGGIDGRWHVSIEDPAGLWRLQGEWITDVSQTLDLSAGKKQ